MIYGHSCATIPTVADESGPPNPAQRVRQRIKDWLDTTGFTQREAAKEFNRTQPWLDKILTGENGVRLRDLDLVAKTLRTTAADLVREESDRRLIELTPSEFRLVERLRRRTELLEACLTLVDAARPGVALSRDEAELLESYRSLHAETQQETRRMLTTLKDAQRDTHLHKPARKKA